MRRLNLYWLVAGAALGLSTAQAGGVLQGLEMDVMEAGETAAAATTRIALPQPGGVVDDGGPDNVNREQAMVGSGEASAVDDGSGAAPTSSEPADGSVTGFDVGGMDLTDASTGMDEDGISGGEPVDTGVTEPDPGDHFAIDPIEVPIGDTVDGNPIDDVVDGGPGDGGGVDGGPGDGDVGIYPVEEDKLPPIETEPPADGEALIDDDGVIAR